MTIPSFFRVILAVGLGVGSLRAAEPVIELAPHWDRIARVSRTTATLQVVVNPPLRRGTPVHANAFQALRDLKADYVRYVPWLPYPKLGVAELEPPTADQTSWDFALIDPMTIDFLDATQGHPVTLNFSTIPQWLVNAPGGHGYPADPDQATWSYAHGRDFRDPSYRAIADYFARIVSWYTRGGFTDELGRWHESGHHYAISHWEVLNEPDLERNLPPEVYTAIYDAVVTEIRKVAPAMEFVGISVAHPWKHPRYFEHFLDPRNHAPGVPLDWISYHFYAVPAIDESAAVQTHTAFAQANEFLSAVRYIEQVRLRLSPGTKTMVNEVGTILPDDLRQGEPGYVPQPIPAAYWNLTGALFAYVFGELAHQGIEVVGVSQLVGYPTQFPSVSMVDWHDGTPNPRFRVLELLKDNFRPGDQLVDSAGLNQSFLYGLAAIGADGRRRLLVASKRDRDLVVRIPGAAGGEWAVLDAATGAGHPARQTLAGDEIGLGAFAVAVLTFPATPVAAPK